MLILLIAHGEKKGCKNDDGPVRVKKNLLVLEKKCPLYNKNYILVSGSFLFQLYLTKT